MGLGMKTADRPFDKLFVAFPVFPRNCEKVYKIISQVFPSILIFTVQPTVLRNIIQGIEGVDK